MKEKYFTLLILISMGCNAQSFYITSLNPWTVMNEVYEVDMNSCNMTPIPTCTGTEGPYYYDIAADQFGNIYFAGNDGGLYKQVLGSNECEYLGSFEYEPNSLVADSVGNIYGIGSSSLYKYNIESDTFSVMGDLPESYHAVGDLFFYENRLFLTVFQSNVGGDLTFLMEINMPDPSSSCVYMPLESSMSAFAVVTENNLSKAYIITSITDGYGTLKELDIINKTVSDPICEFNIGVYGAASVYGLTSTNSVCILNTDDVLKAEPYIRINNPVSGKIEITTNIEKNDINKIELYDILGQSVKLFNDIHNLDVSGISSGHYMLTLSTAEGKIFTNKIVIK